MLAASTNRNPPSGPAIMPLHQRGPADQPAVRPLELVSRHDGGDHRLARGAEDDLARVDEEQHDVQQGDARPAGQHRDGQHAHRGRPRPVDRHHQPPPVNAVDEHPAGQGEQQPGSMPRRWWRRRSAGSDVRALTYSGAATTVRPLPSADSRAGRPQLGEPAAHRFRHTGLTVPGAGEDQRIQRVPNAPVRLADSAYRPITARNGALCGGAATTRANAANCSCFLSS